MSKGKLLRKAQRKAQRKETDPVREYKHLLRREAKHRARDQADSDAD